MLHALVFWTKEITIALAAFIAVNLAALVVCFVIATAFVFILKMIPFSIFSYPL